MHRTPAPASSLDFFLPPSRSHFQQQSPTYSQTGWPRLDSTLHLSAHAQSASRRAYIGKPSTLLAGQGVAPVYLEAPIRKGLRTPPADEMNAYQPTQHQTYPSRQDTSYPAGAPYTAISAAHQTHPTSNYGRQTSTSNLSNVISSSSQRYSQSRTQSPRDTNKSALAPHDEVVQKKSIIVPNLQIPGSINDSGGSLGEFAAQITCFFWFESISTLRQAEEGTDKYSQVKRLVPDAVPTVSFRKWVVTILSTTQVTQNVILLALLFIYRLKTLNPTVKGKAGSEYRLLTVALMLGNKFLDDNTYTNKTWAEVSGISVGEIHVMEVEFLSNMRYSLLASEEQWKEWQGKLGRFAEYFEMAAKAPQSLPSPIHATHSAMLPTSPASMQSSPPVLSTYPSNSAAYNYNQQWSAHYTPPGISPLPSMPDLVPELSLQPSRKRSHDSESDEPAAKRVTRAAVSHLSNPQPRQNLPRLPVPNLSISTNANLGYPTFGQNLPVLPPLSGRAMSTVYPTTPSYTPQLPMTLPPTGPTHHASHSLSGSNYGTPSRRHSPRSMISMNSSPISGNFPAGIRDTHSPSFFLQQRNSPYKPVRAPEYLLYPPPSASMHHYTTNIEQMHYQPLGKRNDYRTGVVPEYANWPNLPQPNFG